MTDWQSDSLTDSILLQLEQLARARKAILIKIDPDITAGAGVPGREDDCENPPAGVNETPLDRKWRYSPNRSNLRNSLPDLNGTEEDWLKCMKQKTATICALPCAPAGGGAGGSGRPAGAVPMYAETSVRMDLSSAAGVLYSRMEHLHAIRAGNALVAKVDGQSVAGWCCSPSAKKPGMFTACPPNSTGKNAQLFAPVGSHAAGEGKGMHPLRPVGRSGPF